MLVLNYSLFFVCHADRAYIKDTIAEKSRDMEEGKTMVQWKDSCYNYVNKRKLGRVLYEKKRIYSAIILPFRNRVVDRENKLYRRI